MALRQDDTFFAVDNGPLTMDIDIGGALVTCLTLNNGNVSYPLGYRSTSSIRGQLDWFGNINGTFYLRSSTLAPDDPILNRATNVPLIVANEATGTRTGIVLQCQDNDSSSEYLEMYQEYQAGFTIGSNRLSGINTVFPLVWQILDSERMRLDTNGSLLIGSSTDDGTGSPVQVFGTGYPDAPASFQSSGILSASYVNVHWFGYETGGPSGGGAIGAVIMNNNSTAIANVSDYRLKTDITDLTDALAIIDRVRPLKFRWLHDSDESDNHGFLAHEFQEIFPQAVTGTRDAVDDNGRPVYQMMDKNILLPWLTAAVKELSDKVTLARQQLAPDLET